ncbi:hypothetical protein DM860_009506 [Cuscuta australis]|uniref:Saposin B-type domain-containing protein n=1 Tax=Cuscuta australis TaxID=267555 RepID=A0A328DIM7_9ASTE|nr:hypothetical protein DM860_009506 [Cuscuta australis]
MLKYDTSSTLLSLLLVSSLPWLPMSECGGGKAAAARKEDIPYIKCQVCQKLALQLFHQVHTKQSQISPKKISEFEIIEISESLCNLEKQEAHWILKIDIVEQGDELALIEQDMEGKCHSKCKTIERACQEVMDYCDTDVAEYLYNNNNLELDSLVNFLCKDLSKACNKTPPPLPKDREPGESFVPKPEEDVEMEKILRSMQGMSMNPWGAHDMRMYSPEELTRYGDGDGDED